MFSLRIVSRSMLTDEVCQFFLMLKIKVHRIEYVGPLRRFGGNALNGTAYVEAPLLLIGADEPYEVDVRVAVENIDRSLQRGEVVSLFDFVAIPYRYRAKNEGAQSSSWVYGVIWRAASIRRGEPE